MKLVGMMVSAVLLLGCAGSVRAPAREATHGFIDALSHPDPKDQLAHKIRDLVEKYVDTAMKAGPPPGIDAITHDVTEGLIKAVSEHSPEERALVQALVHDAASAALRGVKAELPAPEVIGRSGVAVGRGFLEGVATHEADIVRLLSESAGAAGKALTRASSGVIVEQLSTNFDDGAPLSQAIASSAERATSAVVRGVTAGISAELGDCPNSDPALCKNDLVRRMSRSAAMGFTEGVGQKLNIWELVMAAGGGALLALIVTFSVKRLAERKALPAPKPRVVIARRSPRRRLHAHAHA